MRVDHTRIMNTMLTLIMEVRRVIGLENIKIRYVKDIIIEI